MTILLSNIDWTIISTSLLETAIVVIEALVTALILGFPLGFVFYRTAGG